MNPEYQEGELNISFCLFLFYNKTLCWGRFRLRSCGASSKAVPCVWDNQRLLRDYWQERVCDDLCVCVCVWVGVCCGKSCNMKSISSGRKLACRAFEAFVSFHLQKKKIGSSKLNLHSYRATRKKDRKRRGRTEWGRKVNISNVRAFVFRNTELNKSSITHDDKDLPSHSCFLFGMIKANTCILILNEKKTCRWKKTKPMLSKSQLWPDWNTTLSLIAITFWYSWSPGDES